MEDREYQVNLLIETLHAWKTVRRVLLQLATGGGKTKIALDLIKSIPDKTIWFIVHREQLVEQVSEVLTSEGVDHSFIASGRPHTTSNVYVCMIQSLSRRDLSKFPKPDLIIEDEAHHAAASTYNKVRSFFPDAKILGLTATPKRLDNKPLSGSFDVLIQGPSIEELIKQGYLAIPEIAVPPATAKLVEDGRKDWTVKMGDYNHQSVNKFFDDNEKVIYGDVISQYRKLAHPKPTIVFCPNVRKTHEISDLFNANGIPSAGIDGTMDTRKRRELLDDFRSGKILCIMSCDLISEGFDLPDAYAAIMLRPTKSLTIYLQTVGRVLRIAKDKHKCIIIDHVNNTNFFGPPWIQRHWTLDGYGAKTKRDELTGVNLKLCLRCSNYVPLRSIVCPVCGNLFKQKSKVFKNIDTELEIITIDSAKKLIDEILQKIIRKERWKMARTLSLIHI